MHALKPAVVQGMHGPLKHSRCSLLRGVVVVSKYAKLIKLALSFLLKLLSSRISLNPTLLSRITHTPVKG